MSKVLVLSICNSSSDQVSLTFRNFTEKIDSCIQYMPLYMAGPRQVGKTTIARIFKDNSVYLNWDNEDHRRMIIEGPARVAEYIGLGDFNLYFLRTKDKREVDFLVTRDAVSGGVKMYEKRRFENVGKNLSCFLATG